MEKHVFTFRWIIENSAYCWHRKGGILESPTFVVNALYNSKWLLEINPRGEEDDIGLCPIFLMRANNDDGPEFIKLTFRFKYSSENGLTVESSRKEDAFVGKNEGYGFSKVFTQDLLFRHEKIEFSCEMYTKDEPSSEGGYSIATTKIGKESNSVAWEIKEFCKPTSIQQEKIHIKSPSTGMKRMSLKLVLVEGLGCEEYICLEAESTDEKIRVQSIKLFIVDNNGKRISCDLDERAFRIIDRRFLFPLRFSMKQLQNYLIESSLNLICELSYSTGIVLEDISTKAEYLQDLKWYSKGIPFEPFGDHLNEHDQHKKTSALNGLESLYNEKAMCDVKLRTETEVFSCHKLVLSAASPVFRSMFTHPMKEKDSEFVDVLDLEDCILHRMLLYLYSGTLGLNWETACKLYTIADRYQITNLKDKCSSYLKANISVENACEALILADLHQDYELKKVIQNYILFYGASIINSKDWRKIMKTNSQLAAETMQLKWLTE